MGRDMRTYAPATGFLKTIRRCPDEVRADVLLMPYHKERHYNDKMVYRRDDCNQLNLEVLERGPYITCILVDRPFQRGHLVRELAVLVAGETVGARKCFEDTVRVHTTGKAVVGATACRGAH
ncbi:hypothetical protein ZWY2020_030562 [Hordeum vulgare]|nr:hypothetical protein ZWY2020_030562 [Hordeum vulgare]